MQDELAPDRHTADDSTGLDVSTRAPTTAQPLPLLLRAENAAELCGTSVRAWRTWGTSGKIPRPIYIGRTPLWRYDELQAWVAAGCPERVMWDAMRE